MLCWQYALALTPSLANTGLHPIHLVNLDSPFAVGRVFDFPDLSLSLMSVFGAVSAVWEWPVASNRNRVRTNEKEPELPIDDLVLKLSLPTCSCKESKSKFESVFSVCF